jgi:uncharacterized membrane protein YbaN (DUF454 family)
MLRYTQLLLWRISALVALLLGIVGLALPVVPTVPFLILAAWAAGKGSPRLERWLLNHPRYGPHIRHWRERGAVPRRAKVFAIAAMSSSAIALQFTPVPQWLRIAVPLVMTLIAIWLWTRPEA